MRHLLEVRVLQDDGSLSKLAYTYTLDPKIDLGEVKEVSVPMRGKLVKCVVERVLTEYNEVEKVLDRLPYPKDKVIHLGEIKTTVELTAVSKEETSVNDSFKKFLK